ncbi:lysophospholipase and esterase/lipase domain-containing protein [Histoplasma ohiense]|nr:lysophospholipase and esterase/lipase domain-containing protein [Histoplasma ohiense (nom. inval.)]
MELAPIFKKAYGLLAFVGFLYVLGVFSLTYPSVQRMVLYVNQFNPTYFQDVNDAEYFGFLKSQIQPFNIRTPDNETLYAWHIVPPRLFKDNEAAFLANASSGPAEDVTKTIAFNLLAQDPNARVVLNLHGNAAHLGSGYRPQMYRSFLAASTPKHPVHVIAFDYRGFGKSTGSPTEEGLITDALSLINYLTSPPLSIHPSRIVVAGQSLGTAVAAGVVERYTFGDPSSVPEPLAGVIVFAPFSSIHTVVSTYRLFGFFPPILSALSPYPRFLNYILGHIVDTWDSASRFARLTGAFPQPGDVDSSHASQGFDLALVHAVNDAQIPWPNGHGVYEAAIGGPNASVLGSYVHEYASDDEVVQVKVWEKNLSTKSGEKRVKRVRWERVRYGGHNAVAATTTATLSIIRMFEK